MRPRLVVRITLAALLVGAIAWMLTQRPALDASDVERWVQGYAVWAPIVFIGLYAVASVLFLPGTIMTVAGGMLFGPIFGFLYNLSGATIGASLAFLVARYIASDWVAQKVGGRLRRLVEGIEDEGWRFVAVMRLVPLVPFNLLNYALGLTRISLRAYVLASLVFMAPGGAAYTYLGYAGREAALGGEDVVRKVLIALGLLALAAFLPGFVKRLRGKAQETAQHPDAKGDQKRRER